MKKQLLLIPVALVFIYISFVAVYNLREDKQAPSPTAVATQPQVSELAALVNNERVKAGLTPLLEDGRLDSSAADKCSDEVANHYHAHVSPSNVSWTTFLRAHVGDTYDISENLAWDYPTSQATVTGWMKSPAHRGAILNPEYVRVGYAVCGVDASHNEVVQHFISN